MEAVRGCTCSIGLFSAQPEPAVMALADALRASTVGAGSITVYTPPPGCDSSTETAWRELERRVLVVNAELDGLLDALGMLKWLSQRTPGLAADLVLTGTQPADRLQLLGARFAQSAASHWGQILQVSGAISSHGSEKTALDWSEIAQRIAQDATLGASQNETSRQSRLIQRIAALFL